MLNHEKQIKVDCPFDGAEMECIPHGASHFHRCGDCQGIWTSRQFLMGLTTRKDLVEWEADDGPLPQIQHRQSPVHCPGCGLLMVLRLQEQVQIDLCPQCKSVWLDGGEILHLGKLEKRREKKRQTMASRQKDFGDSINAHRSPPESEDVLNVLGSFLKHWLRLL